MWFLFLLCLPCLVQQVSSHGRLIEPPSRASMWRFGFNNPEDFSDMEGFCGGIHQPPTDMKCGICGDPWDESPREHEAGGMYANGIITRKYSPGQEVKVTVDLTANHKGYFVFKLCANNNIKQDPTQECFDATPLEIIEPKPKQVPGGEHRHKVTTAMGSVEMDVTVRLPNIECTQCILQWTYRAGNSWHSCPDTPLNKEYPWDCGIQETFRACSDISISSGDGEVTTPVTVPVSSTTPLPTTTPAPVTTTTPGPTPGNDGDCKDFIKVLGEWGSTHIQGNLVIPLTTALPSGSSGYTIKLATDEEPSAFVFWNGALVKKSGTTFTLTPHSWFAGKSAGSDLVEGFQLSYSTPSLAFTSIKINDREVCGSNEPTTKPITTTTTTSAAPVTTTTSTTTTSAAPVTTTTTTTVGPVTTTTQPTPIEGLPSKVLGLYLYLAEENDAAWTTTADWEPQLYKYQQEGANVLFFSFIYPTHMDVPNSFRNLAATRGTGADGAVPASTKIIFAIGGESYSHNPNPWEWLTTKEKAEAMAIKVASWKKLYNCDGIDLDIEKGAGDHAEAGENMIHFVKKIKEIEPTMLITQPVFGFPGQVPANDDVVNAAWTSSGTSNGILDSVGIMWYNRIESLIYVPNYTQGQNAAITAKVPASKMLVGGSGCADPSDTTALAKACIDQNLGGIIVWWSSVKNGKTWDTCGQFGGRPQTEEQKNGFTHAMCLFKKDMGENIECEDDIIVPEVPWRLDGKCGASNPLSNGQPAQCDPQSGWGPCCSAHGWCGNSRAHCTCTGCTDFRA